MAVISKSRIVLDPPPGAVMGRGRPPMKFRKGGDRSKMRADGGFGTIFMPSEDCFSASLVRILYISSSWPLGKTFGGQLRAYHIAKALQTMGDVSVQVVSG